MKMRKFADEGFVREGPNENIDDDTRARARKFVEDNAAPAKSRFEIAARGREDNAAPAKPKVVTKEELAKSNMSLRDYMNKQQGLTRRDGSTPTSGAYGKEQQYQRAQEAAQTKEQQYQMAQEAAQTPAGKARRSAMAESQALEGSYPVESVAGGAASLLRAGVGKLAGRSAAKEATRVEPYLAQNASRAVSTGAETPVTFLGGTAGRVMNAPRLAGKSTDVVAKEVGAGAKAAERATPKVSGPQKKLAGPKDEADNVKEAARKLSDRDKMDQGRASRDLVVDRPSWARGPSAMKRGGAVKKYASGGSVSSRADGIAQRGKTRGRMC
jgi:hypothetical protein